ncbi:radical SAM protein [Vibrio parahaemolyticus]|nr:radical SAM protein [Vibrio parahaemolyticus]
MLYILKVTDDCFMRCDYCTVKKEFKDKEMDIATVENLFRKSKGIGEVQITFLGGEPLMMSKDWYKEVFALAEKYSNEMKYKVTFEMFTNGMLLNDEWMELLEENKVKVWMSYDGKGIGPKGGKRAQRVLQQYGSRIAGTNTVVTKDHTSLIDIYTELESYGVRYMMHYLNQYDTENIEYFTNMIIELCDYIDTIKRPTTRFMMYDDMKRLAKWDTNKTHSSSTGRVYINNDFVVHTDGTLKGGVAASDNPEYIYGNINEINHIIDAVFSGNNIKHNKDYIRSLDLIGELQEVNMLTRGGGFIWNKPDQGIPLDKPNIPYIKYFKRVLDHIKQKELGRVDSIKPMKTRCY